MVSKGEPGRPCRRVEKTYGVSLRQAVEPSRGRRCAPAAARDAIPGCRRMVGRSENLAERRCARSPRSGAWPGACWEGFIRGGSGWPMPHPRSSVPRRVAAYRSMEPETVRWLSRLPRPCRRRTCWLLAVIARWLARSALRLARSRPIAIYRAKSLLRTATRLNRLCLRLLADV